MTYLWRDIGFRLYLKLKFNLDETVIKQLIILLSDPDSWPRFLESVICFPAMPPPNYREDAEFAMPTMMKILQVSVYHESLNYSIKTPTYVTKR